MPTFSCNQRAHVCVFIYTYIYIYIYIYPKSGGRNKVEKYQRFGRLCALLQETMNTHTK
jgi:hypothetical protein